MRIQDKFMVLVLALFGVLLESIAQNVSKNAISLLKIPGVSNSSFGSIRSIDKDNFGFVWIATQDGLYKYNGTDAIQFGSSEVNPKRRLFGNDVSDIYFDTSQNCLFVLNAYMGIQKIDTRTNIVCGWAAYPALQKFLAVSPGIHMAGSGGFLYIGTNNGQLIKLDMSLKYHSIIELPGNKNTRIEFVEAIGEKIIIGTEGGNVFLLNNKRIVGPFKIETEPHNEIHFNDPFVKQELIYLPTTIGLFVADLKQQADPIVLRPLILKKNINYVYSLNNFLYYSTDEGFFGLNESTGIQYKYESLKNPDDDKWLTLPSVVFHQGRFLLIGSAFGLTIFDPQAPLFHSYSFGKNNNKLKISHAVGICPMNGNELLLADYNGVFTYNLDQATIFPLATNNVFYLASSFRDVYMVSGLQGSFFINADRRLSKNCRYSELDILASYTITQIDSVPGVCYFFSSEFNKGLFVWDFKKRILRNIAVGNDEFTLRSNAINRLYYYNGALYVLCDNILSILDIKSRRFSHYTIINKNTAKVLNIMMDMAFIKGKTWIAVYDVGLVCLNQQFEIERIVDKNTGISNLGLYKLFNIGDTTLLVSSNNGLFAFQPQTGKIKEYHETDGLHGNVFEEFSGCRMGKKIVMGGIDGFTVVDPSKIQPNTVPPELYFQDAVIKTTVSSQDTANVMLSELRVPSNYIQVRITFTGLNISTPRKIKFSYRIKELHSQWVALGDQHFVDLIGASPGTYTLEVKAANEDGVECAPISMILHFQPKWYQTWLFKLAVGLAIAGLLYTLYSFRIKQLKRIISVRQKISSDLHDDIGSTLSTINMYSQVAQLHGPGNVPIMHNIQENAQEVLEKLDDIVWATNPKNDQVKNLAERIDAFARPLLQAKEIEFVFTVDESIARHKIGEASRQNLFLICKEAINNCVKYSRCKTCTVALYKKGKCIHCTITDDGIGFDATQPTERNGLLNMKLRAAAVKGKLEITSVIGTGTAVAIVMSL